MPSPAISRSPSDPFLSSSSKTRPLSSNRSACSSSTRSSKSSYWLAWSNINKLGTFILPGRRSSDSDLTEERLEAHNRRQAAVILHAANNLYEKNNKCSPYYKGLTDATLTINRERQLLPSSASPGRESFATTVASSSSLSSFILKNMQEWSSCFAFSYKYTGKDKDKDINTAPAAAPLKLDVHSTPNSSTSASLSSARAPPLTKDTQNNDFSVVNKKKPLRERVSESKPSPTPATTNDDEKATTPDILIGRKFTWANKYQPKALKDFICNRDQAIKMQGLVRF